MRIRPGANSSADDVRDWINERVQARYQRVREVVLWDIFPTSLAGKTSGGSSGTITWDTADPLALHRGQRRRLHYLEAGGEGLPLVLVPGLTANAHSFDGLLRAGLGDALHVLVFDARGRGLSDKPEFGYAMADQRLTCSAHSMRSASSACISVDTRSAVCSPTTSRRTAPSAS